MGEKRLVRIDEVGRTAAVASLVEDTAGQEAAGDGEPGDDDVQSRPRRRGRRGGRRRSRARGANGGGDRATLSEPK